MPISQLRTPASVQAAGNGRGWQVRRAVCTRRILGRFGSGYAELMTSETQVAAGTAGLSDGEPGAVIHTEDLTKVYGGTDFAAVDKLNLDVEVGEIFGLLGPNGAGKTTTAGMLTTRVVPTSGRAFIAGVDVAVHPALAKQLSGIVSQQNTLDRQLTVWENLTTSQFRFSPPRHTCGRPSPIPRRCYCSPARHVSSTTPSSSGRHPWRPSPRARSSSYSSAWMTRSGWNASCAAGARARP